jgi:hypothetical protein
MAVPLGPGLVLVGALSPDRPQASTGFLRSSDYQSIRPHAAHSAAEEVSALEVTSFQLKAPDFRLKS